MNIKIKQLFKGSAIRVLEFIVSTLLGLLLMPYIIKELGDQVYGLWIFIGSFIGYYGLMDFGLSSAVQRYVSRSVGKKDHEEENLIINAAFIIFLLIGIIVLVLSVCLAVSLPFFIKNISEVETLKTLIVILGINAALGFPFGVFNGILSANLRFDVSTIIELIKIFLRTSLIVFFIINGLNIITLALITILCDLFAHVCKYIAVRYLFPHIHFSLSRPRLTKIKQLFSYSFFSFIAQIADQLRFNVDNFVITALIGLSAVTPYSIGSRLNIYFIGFITAAAGIMTPLFSQYEATNDYSLIKKHYVFFSKICGYLAFLVGGLMIIFGKSFILRWIGPSYSISYVIMLILIISSISNLSQFPSGQMLYGISKHHFFAYLNIAEGILNLILSIILIKKIGLIGVAIGTTAPMLICRLIILPIYTCRCINLSVRDYYLKTFFPVVFRSCISLIPIWIFLRPHIGPNYAAIISAAVFTSLIFLSITLLTGFDKNERSLFSTYIFGFLMRKNSYVPKN